MGTDFALKCCIWNVETLCAWHNFGIAVSINTLNILEEGETWKSRFQVSLLFKVTSQVCKMRAHKHEFLL